MHSKNTVKYNFLYSILSNICSECNLVRQNIASYNSTEKNYDQTLTKNGEQSQKNVKCLNTRFDNFPYFAIKNKKSRSCAPK